jgi:hypothetical protein
VHFWERFLSRQRFMETADAVGVALGAGLAVPSCVRAGDKVVDPKPMPGTTDLGPPLGKIHFFFPGPAGKGNEPSLITDFNGFISVIDTVGSGTGTASKTGKMSRLRRAADKRFMQGVYVGVDGKHHKGTFAFV